MLPDSLKDKYAVTKKVKSPRFNNAVLGIVDLGKITEPLAKKLVKTGHLVEIDKKSKTEHSEKDKPSKK